MMNLASPLEPIAQASAELRRLKTVVQTMQLAIATSREAIAESVALSRTLDEAWARFHREYASKESKQ